MDGCAMDRSRRRGNWAAERKPDGEYPLRLSGASGNAGRHPACNLEAVAPTPYHNHRFDCFLGTKSFTLAI
jgi:hypothetical protein